MYCKPIFIAGKEVPHRELAITVNNIASFLASATKFDFRKNYSFRFEKGKKMFLRLFLKNSDYTVFGKTQKKLKVLQGACARALDHTHLAPSQKPTWSILT
jgi:hypothetical protein